MISANQSTSRTVLIAKWLAISVWIINIPSCAVAGLDHYNVGGPVTDTATVVAYVSFIFACWFSSRWAIASKRRPRQAD
jgi:hypothetical protein